MKLTKEQKDIIEESVLGSNIFVDAVIGSGKTTLLNEICLENSNKTILYLTYNRLLKEDARQKIRLANTEVQNYHGFVYKYLTINKYPYTNQTAIKNFIYYVETNKIEMPQFDMIVVDEYQDINNETAELIKTIDFYQEKNPQLIFVGDLNQKIYDTTTINVISDVIFDLRDDYVSMDLTSCFRINKTHADNLGQIWKKKINGVNHKQKTEIIPYNEEYLIELLNEYNNEDILILTPFRNNVQLNTFISILERKYPHKYNKTNLYITIGENNDSNKPIQGSMIVTTFDGSKGMERDLVLVFGYDTGALNYRSKRSNKTIIRNLFLVAASRGKEKIIFIEEKRNDILTTANFNTHLLDRELNIAYRTHEMYNFVYDSELDKLYEMINIEEVEQEEYDEITAKTTDFNINLMPAIYYYQQSLFFKNWNYESILRKFDEKTPIFKYVEKIKTKDKRKQVLLLTAVQTNLTRYANQAITEFMDEENEIKLVDRLKSYLSPFDDINIFLNKRFNGIEVMGLVDVLRNDIPWKLHYMEELDKKHFLETATYQLLSESNYAMVWNTKNNRLFKVSVKNKEEFIIQMIKTIMKLPNNRMVGKKPTEKMKELENKYKKIGREEFINAKKGRDNG